jgi:outer membrane protein assembly factor BamA
MTRWASIVTFVACSLVIASAIAPAQSQPRVLAVRIFGLERLHESEVAALIETQVGSRYLPQRAIADANRILTTGLFSSAKADVHQTSSGVIVNFVVIENPVVRSIRFHGNSRVDSDTLSALLDTTAGSVLNTNTLRDDLQKINSYYDKLGYIGVRHVRNIDIDAGGIIDITVKEGLTVSNIVVTGNTVVSTATIMKAIQSVPGSDLSEPTLDNDLHTIATMYKDAGYSAIVDGGPDPNGQGIVGIMICEVRVGAIEITGNTKTKDYVIRRLLRLKPGDLVSDAALQADDEALTNTQFFKNVSLSSKPIGTRCGDLALVWTVEEARSGNVSAGVSYSGSGSSYGRGLSGSFGVSERNINGSGDGASVNVDRGSNGSQVNFGVSIPYVRRFKADSLDVSVFNDQSTNLQYPLYKEGSGPRYGLTPTGTSGTNSSIYALYDQHQAGVNVSLGHPMAAYTKLSYDFRALHQSQSISAVGISQQNLDAGSLATALAPNLRGVGFSLVRDNRDNTSDPRFGGTTTLSEMAYTRLVGSDAGFNNVDLDVTRFWRAGQRSTLALHFNGGLVSNPTSLSYGSLFALSDQQLRGQKYTLYGNRELLGQVELRTPLTRDRKLGVVVFADSGDVPYVTNGFQLKTDVGIGLRIRTPLLPQTIRLDLARSSNTSHLSFGIGESF